MGRTHLRLQRSEGIVVQAAAQIYAAYIAAGRVGEGDAEKWISRAVDEAIRLADLTDDRVESDDEVHSGSSTRRLGT